MNTYFLIFILSFLASLILTPIVKTLAQKLKAVDQPGQRKIHAQPIPLLGGLSIFLAFAITAIIFLPFSREFIGIIVAGILVVLFGMVDDFGQQIRARYKIAGHLGFGLVLILMTGIQFQIFANPAMNWILTICWITFMANSFNMLDGLDGLVAGISALASLFFFVFSLYSGQRELAILTLVLAGACLGFLRYNFNPAQIFLGEAGSTFLGFILAVVGIKLSVFNLWEVALSLNVTRLQLISLAIPILILGIPIFDTLFVFGNRFLNKIRLSKAGTDHAHHRIHLMGLSQRTTVLILYGIQLILGFCAVGLMNAEVEQFAALLMIVLILAAFSWLFLAQVEVYSQPS